MLMFAVTCRPAPAVLCLFLLQMRRIHHHQTSQFARGCGGDDLAAESPLGQQRQAPAVIQVGMGKEYEINLFWIETERLAVLFLNLAAALIQTAVDQYLLA